MWSAVRLSVGMLCLGASIALVVLTATGLFFRPAGPAHIHAGAGSGAGAESIFLAFDIERYPVPRARAGAGGGLTRVGPEDVLLMTHDGRLFGLSGPSLGPVALALALPDNGYAALAARAETEAYDRFTLELGRLRYIDILAYSDPSTGSEAGTGRQGLLATFSEWNDRDECYATALAHLALPEPLESVADLDALAGRAGETGRAEETGPDGETGPNGAWEIVFRTRPCLPLKTVGRAFEGHMAGGRLAYRGDGKVVMTSGDYHHDGVAAARRLAQEADTDYGKVLEIDLRTGAARQLSLGHSNPQGVALDGEGRIWVVEHGRRGGDELNLIEAGANYGWPSVTLGTGYQKEPWPTLGPYGRHDGYTRPVYSWLPSVAPSSLDWIEDMHPSWDGDLLASSLSGGSLHRIRVREGRVLFAERIRLGVRIRAVRALTEGRLALWTDGGELWILSGDLHRSSFEQLDALVEELPGDADLRRRVRDALEGCAECHSFGLVSSAAAPALGNVFGWRVGGQAYRGYSPALRRHETVWTRADLAAFLADPEDWAPGTTMPNPGIGDSAVIDGIVDTLARLRRELD